MSSCLCEQSEAIQIKLTWIASCLAKTYNYNYENHMKKIIISLLILAVAGVASYYFVFKNLDYHEEYENYSEKDEYGMDMDHDQSTTTTTWATTTTQTNVTVDVQVKAENKTVAIKGFAFSPSNLTIKKGAKVTWTNEDTAPHDVTQTNGSALKSSTLHKGDSFSFTFDKAGTYEYLCSIHPMMKGSIIVE